MIWAISEFILLEKRLNSKTVLVCSGILERTSLTIERISSVKRDCTVKFSSELTRNSSSLFRV